MAQLTFRKGVDVVEVFNSSVNIEYTYWKHIKKPLPVGCLQFYAVKGQK